MISSRFFTRNLAEWKSVQNNLKSISTKLGFCGEDKFSESKNSESDHKKSRPRIHSCDCTVQTKPRNFSTTRSNNCAVNATDNFDVLLDPKKNTGNEEDLITLFQSAMRKVPQQVVVVTTAKQDKNGKWVKRGITCSSFTSVSIKPPILSFCIHTPSRMHDILQENEKFAVHVLAQDQIHQCLHFAKSWASDSCQFESVPHVQGEKGLPIIMGSLAVLLCSTHSIHTVGDHHVYYGNIQNASVSHDLQDPLLYFVRSFRSVGDQVFLQAFEDTTLPFEDWTHEAHLRMAWNYIKQYGRDQATPYIKLGIQKYNEKNKDKIQTGYHETITMFFIHLVTDAINKVTSDVSFDVFLRQNQHLLDNSLLFQYYSKDTLANSEARLRFVEPDKQPLPC